MCLSRCYPRCGRGVSPHAYAQLQNILRRCGVSCDGVLPREPAKLTRCVAFDPFAPLFSPYFHFNQQQLTTFGDTLIDEFLSSVLFAYCTHMGLVLTVNATQQLNAVLHNHFTMRLFAHELQFQELAIPSSTLSLASLCHADMSGGNKTLNSLDFLEPQQTQLSRRDIAGTSFDIAPLPAGQSPLGWKFSHFVGAVHQSFGADAVTAVLRHVYDLDATNSGNLCGRAAALLLRLVSAFPAANVAEAVLAAQGLAVRFVGKTRMLPPDLVRSPTAGVEDHRGSNEDTSRSSTAADDLRASSPSRIDNDVQERGSVAAPTTTVDSTMSDHPHAGLLLVSGFNEETKAPSLTLDELVAQSSSQAPRDAVSSPAALAYGPGAVDFVARWRARTAELVRAGAVSGREAVDALTPSAQDSTGWLSEAERAKYRRGPAFAEAVDFALAETFADRYGTPQPEDGKCVRRLKFKKPVRDPLFYDKMSDMRNGVPLDTNGVPLGNYLDLLTTPHRRLFEVTMLVGGSSARLVGRAMATRYTVARDAACKAYIGGVLRDLHTVTARHAQSTADGETSFLREFAEDRCRLFATQQQLFAFLDHDTPASSSAEWHAFSIEFPSEQEVVRQLSRGNRGEGSLFTRHTASDVMPRDASGSHGNDKDNIHGETVAEGTPQTRGGGKRPRRPVREDYALLYGITPLSTQSRMFLAATDAGLGELLTRIEPRQRHLYEIIRDGVPCHLYFDVERSSDYVALRQEHLVAIDSNEDSVKEDDDMDDEEDSAMIVTATVHTNHGDRIYRASARRYEGAVARVSGTALSDGASASLAAAHVCKLTCPVRPDNTHTTDVLLRELGAFLRDTFPELVPCTSGDDEGDTAPKGERDKDGDAWHRAFDEVIVMRSVPLPDAAPVEDSVDKFSQHYTIKLLQHRLANSHPTAGELVRRFVDHLQRRAAVDAAVHAALFYHGEPVLLHHAPPPTLTTAADDDDEAAYTLPYLPRRCVIDTAVYSRNRAMRCLGSTKLYKSSVLQLERHVRRGIEITSATCAMPLAAGFFAALITRTSPHSAVFALAAPNRRGSLSPRATPSPERGLSGTPCRVVGIRAGRVEAVDAAVCPEDGLTCARQSAITAELQQAYESLCRSHGLGEVECEVGSAKVMRHDGAEGGRFVLFAVKGTRYCQNIAREHRSNNVYLVVDLVRKTWVQKCFDPDCAHYRSTPQPLRCLQDDKSADHTA